jgi:superfamily I DNA/RNA helicase
MGMKLTDEQRRVVEIDAGSHLVLAPPGSGKTEILSQRILHAMRTGVNPERMLCATFTNRAAYEMRSRVEAQGAAAIRTGASAAIRTGASAAIRTGARACSGPRERW